MSDSEKNETKKYVLDMVGELVEQAKQEQIKKFREANLGSSKFKYLLYGVLLTMTPFMTEKVWGYLEQRSEQTAQERMMLLNLQKKTHRDSLERVELRIMIENLNRRVMELEVK